MSFAPPRPSSQKLREPLLSVTQVSVISTAPATSPWLCCWHRGRIWDVPWWWHCPRPGISHLWSVCSPETPREKNKYQKPQRGQGISALPCISQGILVVPGPYCIPRLAEGCQLVVLPITAQLCWALLAHTHRLRAPCELGILLLAQAGFWFGSE